MIDKNEVAEPHVEGNSKNLSDYQSDMIATEEGNEHLVEEILTLQNHNEVKDLKAGSFIAAEKNSARSPMMIGGLLIEPETQTQMKKQD